MTAVVLARGEDHGHLRGTTTSDVPVHSTPELVASSPFKCDAGTRKKLAQVAEEYGERRERVWLPLGRAYPPVDADPIGIKPDAEPRQPLVGGSDVDERYQQRLMASCCSDGAVSKSRDDADIGLVDRIPSRPAADR